MDHDQCLMFYLCSHSPTGLEGVLGDAEGRLAAAHCRYGTINGVTHGVLLTPVPEPIPEPGMLGLFGLGLIGLGVMRRRRASTYDAAVTPGGQWVGS